MGRYSEGSIFRRLRFPNPNLEYETFGISNLWNIEQLPEALEACFRFLHVMRCDM